MNRLLLLCLLFQTFFCGAASLPFASFAVENQATTAILADTIHPVISCPPTDTVQLAPGECDTIYTYLVNFSDNEPGVILVQALGLPSGATYPMGTTMNFFVALDAAGNTSSCTFSITVETFTLVMTCNDQVVVKLDQDCITTLTVPEALDPNNNGCLENAYVELDKSPPFGNGPWLPPVLGFADLNKSYQFRVTYPGSGNKCYGNAVVRDSLPPQMTCLPIQTSCAVQNVTPAFLRDSLGYATAMPVAMDNCNTTVTPTYVDLVQTLPCTPASNGVSKIISRVWTATDASTNKFTCTQVITLKQSFADVRFPADTILTSCGTPVPPQSVTGAPLLQAGNKLYPLLQAFSCNFDANYYDTLDVTPSCDGHKRIFRTWKVYDLCAAQPAATPLTSIQAIEQKDIVGPIFACPANVTVNAGVPDCLVSVDLPDFIVSDNCSRIHDTQAFWEIDGLTNDLVGELTSFAGNNPASSDTLAGFGIVDNFPVGVTTVVYVATDDCGNTGTCEFALHVWDNTPPVALCDTAFTVYLNNHGVAQVNAALLDNGSNDACNDLIFRAKPLASSLCQPNTEFYSTLQFCCADIGDTIPVTLRVYDVALPAGSVSSNFAPGHFSDCTVQMHVVDTLAPGCVAPLSVTVDCENFDPSLAAYGAPDILTCSVDSISTSTNYTQFDTVCNRGTIVRVFHPFSDTTAGNTCSQNIIVNYKQQYFIKFPDDKIVTSCDGTGQYDEPSFFGNDCELMKVTYTDEVFTVVPDACFKIERTWTVINTCTYDTSLQLQVVPNPMPNPIANHATNLPGPVLSAVGTIGPWAPTAVKINPTDPTATNYSFFWSANVNGYKYTQIIKVIDTQAPVIQQCPAAPVQICDVTPNNPLLWNEMFWWDNVIGSHDLCAGPSDLTVTATDLCSGSNLQIHYLLFLDLDNDGTQETVINSINTGIGGLGWNTVYFGNAGNPNFSGGTPRAFDERAVPTNQKYGFAIQNTVSGNNRTAAVRWNTQQSPGTYTVPELPYGTHRIKWFAEDGCGNEKICEYTFTVKDCKKPTVVCQTPPSVNIPPNGISTLHVSTLLQYAEDNCTPADQLKIAVRKAGTGTGFPVNGNGDPIASIDFGCVDLGTNTVDVWSIDKAGNADSCVTYVIVLDNANNCQGAQVTIAGNIKTDLDTGVAKVNVTLNVTSTAPGVPNLVLSTMTDSLGHYAFTASLFSGSDYTVTPKRNDNPLNGVSTYDLVLMSKHILGLAPLNSPYKMIAADINRNNSVTTTDIVELRKLILGIYDSFPNNDSWRFIDKFYTFPNPLNPFQGLFPENDTGTINQNLPSLDFVGVKVGDMNNSADPSFRAQNAPDRNAETLYFDVTDREVQAGEVFTTHFSAEEPVLGYQFTLNFKELELLEVLPGTEMTADNFGVFPFSRLYASADKTGMLTTSFDGTSKGEFDVRFRASRPGRLSDLLRISSRITPAEAYDMNAAATGIALRFGGNKVSRPGLELYQNIPNPFHGKTTIGFYLPEATTATLTVYNATGRVLLTQSTDYTAGEHAVELNNSQLDAAGILFYKLQTAGETAVRKMVVE